MQIQVQKWGNSLAIRIPKSFAKETNIDKGSVVDLSISDGKLIVTPLSQEKYSLAQLLDEITNENIHEEIDSGDAVGKEIW
ncbi:AbrB/MazE/SpoVT family DNA-binding domain-containing protein [candidate division KSB1 bacterium]|nr:AbrB/MazE/SpoVT family DNA-binding domain-containing protein [candidate division KSB1 bacterium]